MSEQPQTASAPLLSPALGRIVTGLLAGTLFGLGLTISGMVNPAKVLAFLEIFGAWDPSLMFVLGGATTTAFIGYRLLPSLRTNPLFESTYAASPRFGITGRQIAGNIVFGVGWGLVGLCPGPAIVAMAFGDVRLIVFLVTMSVGFLMFRVVDGPLMQRASAAEPVEDAEEPILLRKPRR